jgi:hypothetical protein
MYGCEKNDLLQDSLHSIEEASLLKRFSEPNEFMGQAYCYFVFQEVIKSDVITPDLFSNYIKGGTLSLSFLTEYNNWLDAKLGSKCKRLVGKNFKRINEDSKAKYVIFLNEKVIESEGKSFKVTYNHEKLHVAFSLYKSSRYRIQKIWESLKEEDKEKFIKSNPGYNFSKPDILLREYFAYKFQEKYNEGIRFLIED